MTKKELKVYLRLYPLISNAVSKRLSHYEVILYGRKKKIVIPKWLYKIENFFEEIVKSEKDFVIEEIIEKKYRQGKNDKSIIMNLPVTESGYYRLRRLIENKIYDLYIFYGDVTEEDILKNKIFM